MGKNLALVVGIVLSLVTVLGDWAVKQASLREGFSGWKSLLFASLIYGVTAFGWFFVMRKANFSILGVLYALTVVLMHVLLGVFAFNERVSLLEIIGITMGTISLLLLFRFV